MKKYVFILIFKTILFSITAVSLAQQDQSSLTIEVQVVPQAVLQISSVGQESIFQSGINLDFGRMDAFGQNQKTGILIQRVQDGAIYYHPIIVKAGTSGGIHNRGRLKVSLVPGSRLSNLNFVETIGYNEAPASFSNLLNDGESRVIVNDVAETKVYERLVGVYIRHDTPGGNLTAQMEYSLEVKP
ncbi:MAG: hypothetical protein H7A32_02025 [Deltaproteobacteria bacterium]|nr:hypothetical protein [Deltaproteobacteria bacterium]